MGFTTARFFLSPEIAAQPRRALLKKLLEELGTLTMSSLEIGAASRLGPTT